MALGSSLLCDLVISFSCCYYLDKTPTGFPRSRMDNIVNGLMLYSICTGLVTSTVAVADLVLFFAMKTTSVPVGVSFLIGKLYSNSVLANLNFREIFRREMNTERSVQLTTMPSFQRQRAAWAHRAKDGRGKIYVTPDNQV
ncbi:hypothetical protein BD410DRAFT_640746 [Rickenella mellea]|uniref:DUF6534 domain-containing protein n=1 Tax=Rickenella mellea TaxID=50990 RepID=A0A4Y7PND1_9AGAM|nr:hypothetical protein BD410DRAFT_640746 [Rickenella mellea]